MATRHKAGILLYRRAADGAVEVLIGHRGGPSYVGRDERSWSIPKGGHAPDDDPFDAARREFEEEVGCSVPATDFVPLGEVDTRTLLRVWAAEGDLDAATAHSGTFQLEWPPGSKRVREYLEFDRIAWVPLTEARRKLLETQVAFLDRLQQHLAG
ncbi:NUDIX domain-containing protein [Modestobacter sp. I12A-02628]|uniref:NUDIX domain-containing protein n=1 Tax=Goekera deserti TaxID=2497753 RepID=A0A7K3WGB2_9ACTN|nr:NUDIX domain-containing protein [Goekera deserti]MPQ96559.1 NUDIX domain-containing protein [Goekera deserti]NDI47128.1 NUDIX domain-containing protein [Goekera deserti]NEL55474.1 NUDIX domain-containing protein [Goekera deserti]